MIASFTEKLLSESYDGIIISASSQRAEIFDYVAKLKNDYPEMLIFILLYSGNSVIRETFISCGVDRVMVMPMLVTEITSRVLRVLYDSGKGTADPDVAEFMLETGLSWRSDSFRYLCSAIEIYLKNPECEKNISKEVYTRVAKIVETTPYAVEKSIRKSLSRCTVRGFDGKQTNAKFIKAAASIITDRKRRCDYW